MTKTKTILTIIVVVVVTTFVIWILITFKGEMTVTPVRISNIGKMLILSIKENPFPSDKSISIKITANKKVKTFNGSYRVGPKLSKYEKQQAKFLQTKTRSTISFILESPILLLEYFNIEKPSESYTYENLEHFLTTTAIVQLY